MRCFLLVFAVSMGSAGCTKLAQTDPATAQALMELGDGMTLLRDDLGALQEQNDSLRIVVARTDSVVRVLANLAGVPVPR